MLMTLCCSVVLLQLLSTASPSLSTSWKISILITNILLNFTLYTTNHIWLIVQLNLDRSLKIKQRYILASHLEAQFGHHLRVGLLDPPDLIGQ